MRYWGLKRRTGEGCGLNSKDQRETPDLTGVRSGDELLSMLETCRSCSQRVAGPSNPLLQDIDKKEKLLREGREKTTGYRRVKALYLLDS